MTSLMKALLRLATLFAIALAIGSASAQQATTQGLKNADERLAAWEKSAQKVDSALDENGLDAEAANELRTLIEPQRDEARALAEAAKRELVPLQEQMAALGPAPTEGETEEASLAKERGSLQKKIDELKAIQGKADLAYTRADRLLSEITEAQRARFTERLLTRGPSPLVPAHWAATGETLVDTSEAVAGEAVAALAVENRRSSWSEAGPLAMTAILFAIVLIVIARRYILGWLFRALRGETTEGIDAETERAAFGGLDAHSGDDRTAISSSALPEPSAGPEPSRARRLMVGIGVTLTRLALPVLAILAARQALIFLDILGPTGTILLQGIVRGAIVIAAAYALIYAFFAPREPRLRLSTMNDRQASLCAWLSMLLALTLAADIALVGTGQKLGWPIETLSVLNAAILICGAFILWRLARISRPEVEEHEETETAEAATDESEMWLSRNAALICRRIAYAVALIAPALALAGYFALSRFVFHNVLLTAAFIGFLVLIYSVARESLSALSEVSRGKRRGRKDAQSDDERPGLLPVFIGFVLTLVALPVLALIWGATTTDLGEAYYAITHGITIGETTFRPGDLIVAALVFGLGLFVTRAIQAIMRRTVMPRTRLDVGVRSSIVAGLGYLGFFVAALVAIGVAGLDLSSLAFLGAALGVGIGFGLQNIVNNFVSGIILLIERPIKVGDWIEVSGTHGTVEKVNVRSTEIKTFDKASYIVPNSELISGAVMNMTHGDLLGRVIAPVGVAYGTDPRKVEKVLLEIARAHPMILRRPAPQVVFKEFGADSLNFELRGFLRDVNWILSTHSDLNFEIDRRFGEEGIEFPFAQRDLHIRSIGPLADALRGAPNSDSAE